MDIKIVQNENQVYRKEKLLGEGAFGKAYLVKKLNTQEMLVIKEMNIQHMSQKQKDQTIKEALILKNLNHPNIVHFKEVYATKNNKLKIVMEYADSGDLAKAIHQRKAKKNYIPEGQVLDWFTQICLAIKHVHDRKILHRDIKGQNIFLTRNNSLKLGDFGIARVLNKTMEKARTVVGTPYYLSPQIIQNKPYSFKSDIWSMGAVLYEMCALQPPFNASSLQMLALKIVKGSYSPLQGTYSRQMKSLIAEMLTIDPSKRPSVNDILNKSIIQDRIKQFLTETKRVSEFSHTILHNQKVDLGGVNNRLVQIQKQKYSKNGSQQKNIEKERIKLKEEQQKMQEILKKKKSQEERKKRLVSEEKKRKEEDNKKRQQQRKREQARLREEAKRQWIQRQKVMILNQQREREEVRRKQVQKQIVMREYEQNRRMAEKFKRQHEDDEKNKYNAERQRESRQRKRNEQEYRMRKDNEKKIQKQKKQQYFQEQARRQYFENMQIRKRAEERARREREGDYSQVIPQQQQRIDNAPKRPMSKQQSSRPSSRQNQSYQSTKQTEASNNRKNLLNVQFKGGSQIKQKSSERRNYENKRVSLSDIREKQEEKDEKQKKIEEAREKMRRDRERFMQKNTSSKQQIPENDDVSKQETKVGKWSKRKSSEKRESSRQPSPRFGSPKQKQQEQDCEIIKDSENLFLEVKNYEQFNDYINELEDLVKGVNKKVQVLQQIPVCEQIMFREDDELQFSLTVQNRSENQELKKMKNEDVDLDYFSDYSKLQILRMQLQDAFGLDNFIKLYRMIEEQVREKGLQGFDIMGIQKDVCSEINRETFSKNITLLLTLVSLEDKMNYN